MRMYPESKQRTHTSRAWNTGTREMCIENDKSKQVDIQYRYNDHHILRPSRKTSSHQQPRILLPRASAQDGFTLSHLTSPTFSTTSTADGEDEVSSSPILSSLPAPVLSERVRAILRTPPSASSPQRLSSPPVVAASTHDDDNNNNSDNDSDLAYGALESDGDAVPIDPRSFITSWGSPYPESDSEQVRLHLRDITIQSDSDIEELSEDELIHSLDLQTPFLRPPPEFNRASAAEAPVFPSASALIARARRGARGLTEEWIRQHMASPENFSWFTENETVNRPNTAASGTITISGHSSLRSSFSGSAAPWHLNEGSVDTLRESLRSQSSVARFLSNQSKRSSIETLRASQESQQNISAESASVSSLAASGSIEKPFPVPPSISQNFASESKMEESALPPVLTKETRKSSVSFRETEKLPPRVRKKIPWNGKNILFCLPREDKRGQDGRKILYKEDIDRLYKEWEGLGYNTQGWVLEKPSDEQSVGDASQSRTDWPLPEDVAEERKNMSYKVTLPDLDAWAKYTAELQEAKLRALGVLTAAETPIPPTPSPGPTQFAHRRISTMQHPGQVFSPPLPTSSAGSFVFPPPFNRGAMNQSPGINSVPTSVSMHGGHPAKYNNRQSISISSAHSPFQMGHPSPNWAQQAMMMHGLQRVESPLSYPLMSPSSPFQPGSPAMNMHQRHQSMQYPMATQQFYHQPMQLQMPPARGTPIMREVVQEEEEEEEEEEGEEGEEQQPQKAPEPPKPEYSPSPAPENEDYHLEKQLMKELDHEDYNPNNEPESTPGQPPASTATYASPHQRQQSVSFAGLPTTQFASSNTVLHHPRPHSRGHSLANNFYMDKADGNDDSLANQLRSMTEVEPSQNDFSAIQTNPSAVNTPGPEQQQQQQQQQQQTPGFDFAKHVNAHHHTFSIIHSNPWKDSHSANPIPNSSHGVNSSRQSSNGSKVSFSKLNVEAPEFKFNPTSTFTPGGTFNFGASTSSSTFEPFVGAAATANNVTTTPSSSKISATAPTFSPGQSSFDFKSFRPDAPAFMPFTPGASTHSMSDNNHFTGSIFGSVEIPDVVKPPKKSKAIPIVPPTDAEKKKYEEPEYDAEGRPVSTGRTKRARGREFSERNEEDDQVPLFAEPSKEDVALRASSEEKVSEEDEATTPALDTSMTLNSDTKPSSATSPSVESVGQRAANWAPFEFDNKADMLNFNEARPFGDDWSPASVKKNGHKKSLSVTAKVFVPGASAYEVEPAANDEVDEPFEPLELFIAAPKEDSEESADETTPIPEHFPKEVSDEPPSLLIPTAITTNRRMEAPSLLPPRTGLKASRFASPSPTQGLEADDTETGEMAEQEIVMPDNGELSIASVKDHLTFEEIDDIMLELNKDPAHGEHRIAPRWQPTSPAHLLPAHSSEFRSASLSPSRHHQQSEIVRYATSDIEDPFIDPPRSGTSFAGPIRCLNGVIADDEPNSDWDGTFPNEEEDKLAPRAAFFDGRVNQLVDEVLAARLEPLERALFTIQDSLGSRNRSKRTLSGDTQQSDADDEDEEPSTTRNISPRRDKRLDAIRSIVSEAVAQQAANFAPVQSDNAALLSAIEELKSQVSVPRVVDENPSKSEEMQAHILELEQRLHIEESRLNSEIEIRRNAEDRVAELGRTLQNSESRFKYELATRNLMENNLRREEDRVEEEIKLRRAAEDKAASAHILLKAANDEKERLGRLLAEKEEAEAQKPILVPAAAVVTDDIRLAAVEAELALARQEAAKWRSEYEAKDALAVKHAAEVTTAQDENNKLQRLLSSIGAQLEENERIRESWRNKFISIQEELASATQKIYDENGRRILKEQQLLACQEVLESKLKAEARTRERLEREVERLGDFEKEGARAINDNKRLELLLADMRTENHKLHMDAMRDDCAFREDLEQQIVALRAELTAAHAAALAKPEVVDQKAIDDFHKQYKAQIAQIQQDAQVQQQMLKERIGLVNNLSETLKVRVSHLEGKLEIANQAAAAAAQRARSGSNAASAPAAPKNQLPEKISPQALRESIMVLQEQLLERESRIEELEKIAKKSEDVDSKITKRDDEIVWLRELLAVRHTDLQDIISALETPTSGKFDREALCDAVIRLKTNLQMEEQERERAANGGSAIALPLLTKTWSEKAPKVASAVGPLAAAWGNWRKNPTSWIPSVPPVPSSVQAAQAARRSTPLNTNSVIAASIAASAAAAGPPSISTTSTSMASTSSESVPTPTAAVTLQIPNGLMTPPSAPRPALPLQATRVISSSGAPAPAFTALSQYAPADEDAPQMTAFAATGRRITSGPQGQIIMPKRGDRERPRTPDMMKASGYDDDAQGVFDEDDFFED